MSCKDKRCYFSIEEAMANMMPHMQPYECSECGKFHLTSNAHKRGNKKRFVEWKRKKRP